MKRIDLGERQLRTMHGHLVTFSPTSTIEIVDEKEELSISLDPTDLSAIYGAYIQMQKELNEDESK